MAKKYLATCRICKKPIRVDQLGVSAEKNGQILHVQCYTDETMENRKKNEKTKTGE